MHKYKNNISFDSFKLYAHNDRMMKLQFKTSIHERDDEIKLFQCSIPKRVIALPVIKNEECFRLSTKFFLLVYIAMLVIFPPKIHSKGLHVRPQIAISRSSRVCSRISSSSSTGFYGHSNLLSRPRIGWTGDDKLLSPCPNLELVTRHNVGRNSDVKVFHS